MATTQTRITPAAHERLVRLAAQTGKPHQQILDIALRAYERQLFLESVNAGFAALRENPEAWAQEVAERAAWEMSLSDGDHS
jgi:hypothetical protein